MIIEWDETKNKSNQKKHGLNFELAQYVFDDPFQYVKQDRTVDGEPRWQTIGMINGVLLVLVAHTVTDDDTGEEVIRIISARRTEKYERKLYEKENNYR